MFIPVRLRQFPRFVIDMARRRAVQRRSQSRRGSITLCYFSCASYYKYQYCSLHSLRFAQSDVPVRVIVFCDRNEMFSGPQREALMSLVPGLEIITWDKSQGWGATQIASIWRAYAHAAEGCGDDDYVGRIDADVFFFSPWLFDLVLKSGADLIGDGHYVRFEFCQGGVYFLKAKAIRNICAFLNERKLEEILSDAKVNVEDMATYHLVQATGHRSWLTWFMMFPDEYRIAGRLNKYQRQKFSCLHFAIRNKEKMLQVYRKELIDPREGSSFEAAISIL